MCLPIWLSVDSRNRLHHLTNRESYRSLMNQVSVKTDVCHCRPSLRLVPDRPSRSMPFQCSRSDRLYPLCHRPTWCYVNPASGSKCCIRPHRSPFACRRSSSRSRQSSLMSDFVLHRCRQSPHRIRMVSHMASCRSSDHKYRLNRHGFLPLPCNALCKG